MDKRFRRERPHTFLLFLFSCHVFQVLFKKILCTRTLLINLIDQRFFRVVVTEIKGDNISFAEVEDKDMHDH